MATGKAFIDYYEVLQISPRAELASVVTSKPANGGDLKTGQRTQAG